MPVLQFGNPKERTYMSQMQATNIMGRSLTREAKTQPITGLQKICVSMLIATFACSLIMLMLKVIGMIQIDVVFFQHILIVVTSAPIGLPVWKQHPGSIVRRLNPKHVLSNRSAKCDLTTISAVLQSMNH